MFKLKEPLLFNVKNKNIFDLGPGPGHYSYCLKKMGHNTFGIDRVVPIGQALDMTFIWDGYDINRLLSREIEIR